MIPVILSGGAGERLWPLSRDAHPKQFHSLVDDELTLFQQTILRTRGIDNSASPIVICNESHRFFVAEQLRQLETPAAGILLEPKGRNTAPAIAAAALWALRDAEAGSDPLLLVLAADHIIDDVDEFHRAVAVAVDAADAGYLVTFGVVPDRPEIGYGYLLKGEAHGAWSELAKFVEKPSHDVAVEYLESGRYLWNSGMFLFSAKTYLAELEAYEPAMLEHVRDALAAATIDPDFVRLGAAFAECPADSVDYAVMEKTEKAAVVPLDAGWSDVGSWPALYDVLEKDDDGNVVRGDVLVHACRNSLIASSSRTVGVIGLDGVVVIETEDAVLVMSQQDGQRIKKIVEQSKS